MRASICGHLWYGGIPRLILPSLDPPAHSGLQSVALPRPGKPVHSADHALARPALGTAADEGGDEDWGPSAHVEHRTDPEERRGFFQKSRQAPGHVHGRVRARPAVRALPRVPSAELCGVAGWESAWFWSRRRVLAVPNEPADDYAFMMDVRTRACGHASCP